jgi:6-pyruvoyltetrahydropterin/6-carboxytetrahydropterin synthase
METRTEPRGRGTEPGEGASTERDAAPAARAAPAGAGDAPAERGGRFRVHVSKDYLVFASAHFITFEGHRCETLHGHNYRVGVTCEGALDPETWYVFDFGVLKKIMKALCDEIDHRVLLPTESPKVAVEQRDDMIHVAVHGRPRYVFPARDCALLPVPNTTVEMLARHLARQLRARVATSRAASLTAIEVEVEENFGQSAFYREDGA